MKGLLEGYEGSARRARASWIAALHELQRSGRAWCTLGEWLDTWPSDVDESLADVGTRERTAKRQRHRLQDALRAIGLELVIETIEGEGLRIGVGSSALRELVELEFPEARAILDGRDPEPNVGEIVRHYWLRGSSLARLARVTGLEPRRIRAIVVAAKKPIRPRGRPTVERSRPSATLESARKAVLAKASVRAIARILRCSWAAAASFRKRTLRSARTG